MASEATIRSLLSATPATRRQATAWSSLRTALMPVASLKLTVALLGMGLFLVLAGTFAQTKYDMTDVLRGYFRTWFTWIELQIFFPPAFFPDKPQVPGGFPFPGGLTLGVVMFINLLAAHSVRFTVQTRGMRLVAGLAVIALGLLVTWLVVIAGEAREGVQSFQWIPYDTLWTAFKTGVVLLAAAVIAATVWAFLGADPKRRIYRRVLTPIAVVLASVASYLLWAGDAARLSDPSMRILSQLIYGLLAGGVLLAGSILAFKKRAGIVVLHFGVGLLMFNELWVYGTHVEAQVTLEEKGGRPDRVSANWVQDVRELELAWIVRGGGPDGEDHTIAIPESVLLRKGGKSEYQLVQDEQLPFDVQVVTFYRNAEMRTLPPGEKAIADAGHGRSVSLVEQPPVTGVDKGENQPAAYVRFFAKGQSEPLGTHLVSTDQTYLAQWYPTNLDSLEEVRLGGKTYEVYLRYKRINKPYTISLDDVRRDNYLGTETPRDYSSNVHIESPDTRGDAPQITKAHIWMNNPLRFRGDTLYQSGYHPPETYFGERSTLSVVTNGGWMIPYVCCMIVAVGMGSQFVLTLLRFLSRMTPTPGKALAGAPVELVSATEPAGGAGQGGEPATPRRDKRDRGQQPGRDRQPSVPRAPLPLADVSQSGWRYWVRTLFPVAIVVIFAGWVGGRMRPASEPARGELRLQRFGKIPVVYEGRPKPLDSIARNALMVISGRQEYVDYRTPDDAGGIHGTIMKALTGNPDSGKPKLPAMGWLLDVMSGAPDADQQRVFRVDNPEVLKELDLKPRKGFLYSFEEISQAKRQFDAAVDEAAAERKKNPKGLSIFQRKILKLNDQFSLYNMLRVAFLVPRSDTSTTQAVNFIVKVADLKAQDKLDLVPYLAPRDNERKPWEPLTYASARAKLHQLAQQYKAKTQQQLQTAILKDLTTETINAQIDQFVQTNFMIETIETILSNEAGQKRTAEELRAAAVQRYRAMPAGVKKTLEELVRKRMAELSQEERRDLRDQAKEIVLQNRENIASQVEEEYKPELSSAFKQLLGDEPLGEPDAVAVALTDMLNAARDRRATDFNEALDKYEEAIAAAAPPDYKPVKTRFEASFNHAAPFYYASILHLFAFLFVAASWMGWRKPLNNTAFWLIVLALAIHTAALVARIYISGRPPVTNLYSSAVFIGWGAVAFGIVIELIYGMGIGNCLASAAGFGTLLIAHFLALDGDTFTVLQAVLDTQFWLATHVVCITLGYATTFVAGLLAMRYVISGVLSRSLTPEVNRLLTRLIYGVLCFALFFSFVGTVLGGLWADDSWGRFWGWDPKENGALIIVLWNAIVLHARWGGMVKDRGLAVLALGGNIVTSWSWFGVNELGIGLHSYGFTEGVLLTMGVFMATQLVLIIVGSLPKSWWWSFSAGDGAGQGGAA